MTDRELLKQALYLIDAWERGAYAEEYPTEIEALRQALAQPDQTKCPRCGKVNPAEIHTCSPQVAQPEQEPVAYKYTHKTNPLVFYFTERKGKDVTQNPDVIETALYTAPPKQWVGLTLDDIPESYAGDKSFLNIARWAEAKLKEKNT